MSRCIAFVLLFAAPAFAQVDFRSEIAPVLVQRCLGCHGESRFKGGYRLHTLETLRGAGESGEAVISPGKPESSMLLDLIVSTDASVRMPKDAAPLSKPEVDALRRWIADGAKLDGVEPQTPLVQLARWKHPEPPVTYATAFPVTALAFRPDGQELAVSGCHEVLLCDPADGKLLRRIPGLAERTYALAYTQDGARLLVAAGTPGLMGEVRLLNAADGSLARHFGSFSDSTFAAVFSPDEKRLAVAGADGRVRVFDAATGKEEWTSKEHADWVMSVAWSPDGSRLASASRDKTCKVFDAQTGGLVTTYTEHGNFVYGVAYHSDGKHAISAGNDGKVHQWIAGDPGWENPEKQDKKKKHQVASLQGFTAPVHQLTISGSQVFACSADLSARQFDLEKKASVRTYAGHQDWLFAVAFHASTKRLATAGLDGQIRIWKTDAKDEKEVTFVAKP